MWLLHIMPINYPKVFTVHLVYFWQTEQHHSYCFMAIAQSKQTPTQPTDTWESLSGK